MDNSIPALESKPEDALNAEKLSNGIAPPPPRTTTTANEPTDYFSQHHSLAARSTEANPFELSFAGGPPGMSANIQTPGGNIQTPCGTKLPSVAALTSPAGILGQDYWNSLRAGPLSPAMLAGPQRRDDADYFSDGHHLRGGFPTPNESSLRSGLTTSNQAGLTPGGGGSMFPEPSPNTLFNSLPSGGATPSTLEFHRTALNALNASASTQAHLRRESIQQPQQNITSQPQDFGNGADVKPPNPIPYDRHDPNDAANSLFMLAHAGGGPTANYAMGTSQVVQMPIHAHPQSMQSQTMQPQSMQMGVQQSANASPQMGHRNNRSMSTNSGRGVSVMSEDVQEQQPISRPTSPRGNSTRKRRSPQAAQTNGNGGRTKAKGAANKRAKGNNGKAMSQEPKSDVEEEVDLSKDQYNANGKKMTDEEKRKNFLERNRYAVVVICRDYMLMYLFRVAALKCRQRKKQWLANLQQKCEAFTAENDNLQMQVSSMRDEIVNLKTMLLAHKDCPVSQQHGINGANLQHAIQNGFIGQMNPYGMAQSMNSQQQHMNGQQQAMAGQDVNSRYS